MQAHLTLQQPRVLPTSRSVSRRAPIGRRQLKTQALDTSLVISGATATSLALGRFVFLPFHRDNLSRQLPKQNDTPYAEAGDRLAQVSLDSLALFSCKGRAQATTAKSIKCKFFVAADMASCLKMPVLLSTPDTTFSLPVCSF